MRRALLLAACAAVAAGCLPGSQRQTDRSLTPEDSAAVAFAATVPVDTLAVVWTRTPPLALATGVTWLPADSAHLAVVETQTGAVHRFTTAGEAAGVWPVGEARFPYLAGTVADSVIVLTRGGDRLQWIGPRGVGRQIPVPAGATAAWVREPLALVRVGGGPEGGAPALVRLDVRTGQETARFLLPGPPWRSVGFLRAWGDSVLALSGYRPVADVWTPASAGRAPLDSLTLVGFASPQLGRSAQYLRGDVEEPPLLAASGATLGDRLFLLNLRDDGVRVDVYGRDGRLQRALVGPGPPRTRDVVDVDLAVRQTARGVEIAIVSARPGGGLGQTAASRLTLYRWNAAP